MKKRKPLSKVAYICLILILVLVIIYSGLQILESTVFFKETEQDAPLPSKTITRNGIQYFPRQDITVLLVTGIDQFGPMVSSGSYNNLGCVDMINLVVFDETNKDCRILSLNRDTMVNVPVLGLGGKYIGDNFEQLALSHTYGSGMQDSSENTRTTVSNFLYGIKIDQYITANMEAIEIINDAVGGVTVHVTDDFSKIDPSLTMGTITLHGDQAINYVRSRGDVGDQLNISRMERQKDYMKGFMDSLHNAVKANSAFVFSTYDEISDYMVTDCSTTVLNNMLNRYADFPIVEIVSPAGENALGESAGGEKHYEFYADEDDLDQLILRLFYAPKK